MAWYNVTQHIWHDMLWYDIMWGSEDTVGVWVVLDGSGGEGSCSPPIWFASFDGVCDNAWAIQSYFTKKRNIWMCPLNNVAHATLIITHLTSTASNNLKSHLIRTTGSEAASGQADPAGSELPADAAAAATSYTAASAGEHSTPPTDPLSFQYESISSFLDVLFSLFLYFCVVSSSSF